MLNKTAVARQLRADDTNGLIIITTGNIKGVAAETTDDLNTHILIRAGDKECIVAFQTIYGNCLNTTKPNWQACSENTIASNHKVISKLGTKHSECIEAIVSFNVDRSIHRIFDEVSTLSTVNIGKWSFRIVWIDLDKCIDTEGIVIFFTEHEEFLSRAIDRKAIITRTTINRQRMTGAIT